MAVPHPRGNCALWLDARVEVVETERPKTGPVTINAGVVYEFNGDEIIVHRATRGLYLALDENGRYVVKWREHG